MRRRIRDCFCFIAVVIMVIAQGGIARASPVLNTAKCDDMLFTQKRTGILEPISGNFPEQLVTVPQFHPDKGTLCFAVVRITANYDALIEAENLSGTSAIITSMGTQTIHVTPPPFVAPMMLSNTETLPLSSHLVGPFDGTIDFAGPSGTFFTHEPDNPFDVVLANVIRDKFDSGFDDFIGVGMYDFAISGEGDFTVSSNSGAVVSKVNMRLGAEIQVVYHYIPEPSALALLLPAGLLIRRRRR